MPTLLEEFLSEGLLPERVIPNDDGNNNGEMPKVNPDAPQNMDSSPKTPSKMDVDNQSNGQKDKKDTAMNAAMKAMECAEYTMENLCESCGKRHEYAGDKMSKLQEIYESIKQLRSSLYEIANSNSNDDSSNAIASAPNMPSTVSNVSDGSTSNNTNNAGFGGQV